MRQPIKLDIINMMSMFFFFLKMLRGKKNTTVSHEVQLLVLRILSDFSMATSWNCSFFFISTGAVAVERPVENLLGRCWIRLRDQKAFKCPWDLAASGAEYGSGYMNY